MDTKIVEMIQWFAQLGESEYPSVPGNLSMLDLQKLRRDRDYGIKCFLTYMGAREGATKGFVPAWIKVVSRGLKCCGSFRELFTSFYHAGANGPRNPMWDQDQLSSIDVPACIEQVRRGELSTAFSRLRVRGAGHKIRAVFLLDLAVFTDAEPVEPDSWTIAEHYLYCQPMDMWVDFASDCLAYLDQELPVPPSPKPASRYGLDQPTIKKACRMINLALNAGVSPLKLNQGVWFFASQVAPDKSRLKELLVTRRAGALKDELELMRGFLPSDWLGAEMADEQKWQRSFALSRKRLGELADEALAEHRAGLTQVLDPDKL